MIFVNYIKRIEEEVKNNFPNEPEYVQAVLSFLESIEGLNLDLEQLEKMAVLERLIIPERVISFRVSWLDDQNQVRVNTGYRIQHSSLIGPYKGGLRYHKTVNLSTLKFLAFEQTFKNALTGLLLGGAKGGSDFDPKGKSDAEIMRFSQNFMLELYRHIGENTDVPAGDIGVGRREIGYLYGMYKKIRNESVGVLTGKHPAYGGSLVRTEATGYGLVYFVKEMLKTYLDTDISHKDVIISGSGNVALYAGYKAKELGANVIAMSNSKGHIYDPNGIDLDYIKEHQPKGDFREAYVKAHEGSSYSNDPKALYNIKCDIALPCAIQNELDLNEAKILVDNGCFLVAEGANMPTTTEAKAYLLKKGILFGPGKAANAGGVSVSLLEMSQNKQHYMQTFDDVDEKLESIMKNIFNQAYEQAILINEPKNLVKGANIRAFYRLCEAMLSQGVI